MTSDYYTVLGLPDGSSVEDIKRAYRKKAREYHPDLNHSPAAMDLFIEITEAYEFLLTHFRSIAKDSEESKNVKKDWDLYQRDIARKRAKAYARASYIQFKNTKFYKTTRIFDATTTIFSLAISLCIILMAVYGYIWKMNQFNDTGEKPSIVTFILLLSIGGLFLAFSLASLKAYYLSSKGYKARHNEKS